MIFAPLAVSRQTQREGEKLGVHVTVCKTQPDISDGVNVTNYEKLHHFAPEGFGGLVLDESSILTGFDGSSRKALESGHIRIQKAFNEALPTTHQQCSEKIEHNRLMCCLGTEVPKCEILVSIKTLFDDERTRKTPSGYEPYKDVSDEHCFRIMARTCAWHIYKTVTKGQEEWAGVDTSEGYHLDEGDRRFWARVYESMAYNTDQPEEE